MGVDPKFIHYEGDDPISHAVSLNMKRRHLTVSKRAMIAARLANLERGENARWKDAYMYASTPKTIPAVAKELNIGTKMVSMAKKIIREGSASLIKAVDSGEISVSAADKVTGLPKEEQDALVAKGTKAVSQKGEGRQWLSALQAADSPGQQSL